MFALTPGLGRSPVIPPLPVRRRQGLFPRNLSAPALLRMSGYQGITKGRPAPPRLDRSPSTRLIKSSGPSSVAAFLNLDLFSFHSLIFQPRGSYLTSFATIEPQMHSPLGRKWLIWAERAGTNKTQPPLLQGDVPPRPARPPKSTAYGAPNPAASARPRGGYGSPARP